LPLVVVELGEATEGIDEWRVHAGRRGQATLGNVMLEHHLKFK
jgi:hypothetical protein